MDSDPSQNPSNGQNHIGNYDPNPQLETKGTLQNKQDFESKQDLNLQHENKIDLSFLKPITTKKKVVNIFQNSNKDA